MNDIIALKNKKKERALALANDRRRILTLEPEQALEAIAEHPYPVTLIQSFSEEDLYFFLNHIGMDDALPVLAMASNEQWQYLVDMEIWRKDRPDDLALTRWLERLLRADPDRFTHWILHEQRDLLEYYLFRNLEVHIREYEQDPAEVGEQFFSEDQVHYVRLRKFTSEDPQAQAFEVQRDTLILDVLKRIAVVDLQIYQHILLESSVVIPAEAEEELLRLRSIRMAEKGFLPFDEAVGVYQSLSVADLMQRQPKPAGFNGRQVESYPLEVESIHLSEKADLFVRTLAEIRDQAAQQQLQTEFAGLCNQVVAADQNLVREKADLAQVVDKVSGYVSLGLEKINAGARDQDPYRNANMIQTYLLADIFRVGYGCALSLKWQADKWRRESWFARAGLPLGFWGEDWLGVLGGLLIKKPLFFDNYATGVLYREFRDLKDIDGTGQALEQIIAMDHLLSRMGLDMDRTPKSGFITYANLLLTQWANHYLGRTKAPEALQPISLSRFRSFFDALWESQTTPRRISDTSRENFLYWLAQRCALATYDITERLGPWLEALFQKIEDELGRVADKDLDPHHIHLFLIEETRRQD